jgi:hypothetical protein
MADSSLVPPENQIRPPPNQFSHQVIEAEPFYFRREADSNAPDGQFAAGTKVLLLRSEGGSRCRVADERGLYVEVSRSSLSALK